MENGKPETDKRFDRRIDYRQHVDGKPRYDGVRSFLKLRSISLPEGAPEDSPDHLSEQELQRRAGCGWPESGRQAI